MALWGHVFNPAAMDPRYWDEAFGGPGLFDIESQRNLRRPRHSGMAKNAARLAKAAQALPAVVGVGVKRLMGGGDDSAKKRRLHFEEEDKEDDRKPFIKATKTKNMPYGRRKRSRSTPGKGAPRSKRFRRRSRSYRYTPMQRRKAVAAISKVIANRAAKKAARIVKKSALRTPVLEYRLQDGVSMAAGVNNNLLASVPFISKNVLEVIVSDTTPEYDDAGALSYKNLNTADFTGKMHSWGMVAMDFANNYNFGAHLDICLIHCKQDTDALPETIMENNMDAIVVDTAEAIINNAHFEPIFGMKEVTRKYLKPNWRLASSIVHKKIMPGETCHISFKVPKRTLDFQAWHAIGDTTYVKNWSFAILYRLRGQVAHDQTTDTLVGYSSAQLDCVLFKYFKYYFESGNQVKKVAFSDSLDTIVPETVTFAIEEADALVGDEAA